MISRGGRRASGAGQRQERLQIAASERHDEDRALRGGRRDRGGALGSLLGGSREVETRILLQDRSLERLERRGRVDAELLDQRAPRLLVGLERLGLSARPVQREHQLTAQPLAQRVLRDETLELADELRMAAEREIGLDPLLERREAKLLEADDRGLGELLVGEVRQRRAAPERERLAELCRGGLGPPASAIRPGPRRAGARSGADRAARARARARSRARA